MLVVTAVVIGFQLKISAHPLSVAMLITGLVGLCMLSVVGPLAWVRTHAVWSDSALWARILTSLCLVLPASQIVRLDAMGSVAVSAVVALAVMIGGLLTLWLPAGRPSAASLAAMLSGWSLAVISVIRSGGPDHDFLNYLQDATNDLAHGRFPYGGSVANPYSAEMSRLWLAPELVHHGRILIGFPYLPSSLLTDVPGRLLGDARYSHVIAVVVSTLLLRRLAVDEAGRALSVLLVASPLTFTLVAAGWIEPVLILALVALGLATVRGRRIPAALSLAFLLAGKQYIAPLLPFVVSVGRRLGWAVVVAGFLVAGVVTSAFFLWGPRQFWHDVVVVQLLQPYRPDAISLTVALGNRYGVPPSWVLTVVPLAAGWLVSSVVSWRGRPGATTTAAALGLGLLATLMLSKQAFVNYFAFVQAALLVAAITWPIDGPRRDRRPRHEMDARR